MRENSLMAASQCDGDVDPVRTLTRRCWSASNFPSGQAIAAPCRCDFLVVANRNFDPGRPTRSHVTGNRYIEPGIQGKRRRNHGHFPKLADTAWRGTMFCRHWIAAVALFRRSRGRSKPVPELSRPEIAPPSTAAFEPYPGGAPLAQLVPALVMA